MPKPNYVTWNKLSVGTQLFILIGFGLALGAYLVLFQMILSPQTPECYEYEEVCVEESYINEMCIAIWLDFGGEIQVVEDGICENCYMMQDIDEDLICIPYKRLVKEVRDG